MAIEYYDFEKQDQLNKLFLKKLNDMMSDKKIIQFLDEISKEGNDNNIDFDNDKLKKEIFPNFAEDPEKDLAVIKKRRNTAEVLNSYVFVPEQRLNTNTGKKISVVENKKQEDNLKERISNFNTNLNKLQDNISFDIKNQSNIFEEKKRKKMEKNQTCRGGKFIYINYLKYSKKYYKSY